MYLIFGLLGLTATMEQPCISKLLITIDRVAGFAVAVSANMLQLCGINDRISAIREKSIRKSLPLQKNQFTLMKAIATKNSVQLLTTFQLDVPRRSPDQPGCSDMLDSEPSHAT